MNLKALNDGYRSYSYPGRQRMLRNAAAGWLCPSPQADLLLGNLLAPGRHRLEGGTIFAKHLPGSEPMSIDLKRQAVAKHSTAAAPHTDRTMPSLPWRTF